MPQPLDPSVEREIRRIDDNLRDLRTLPTDVAVMKRDVEDIKSDVGRLTSKVDVEAETRMREREKDSENRKTSLRWTIGTLLLCTGTVIGAVGLLLSAFGGSP